MNELLHLKKLLAAIVSPTATEQDYSSIKNSNHLSLIELANSNFMNFALYAGLQAKNLLQYFSEQEKNYLADFFELNRQRNQHFLSELGNIVEALNKNDIEPVLLKGAVALVDHWYEDNADSGISGERFLRDIDFLVPEHQAQQAFQILIDNGYELVNALDEDLHQVKTHQLAALHKLGSPLVVEIHTAPISLKAKGLLTAQQVLQNKKSIRFQQFHFFIPSPEHCLLIALAHTQIADSHLEKGIFFLRHGMDIQRILIRYPTLNYQALNALCNQHGFTDLLANYLVLLDYFFATNYLKNSGLAETVNATQLLNKVIHNITTESIKHKTQSHQSYFKQQALEAFSSHKITMRYGVESKLKINMYRIVNLFRLLKKYASPNNRNKLKKSLEDNHNYTKNVIPHSDEVNCKARECALGHAVPEKKLD